MAAYVLSFVDRQIMNLLVAPIRRDLGINDTQMSLLMGFSFAIFYTILGIPMGRLADSRSRRGLIAAGVVVWSAMTALCGLAQTYWQLFLYRVGVGVGEATLSPAAYSMIADYFPPERRATAISVYSMGIFLGSGIAFLLGGLVIKFAMAAGGKTGAPCCVTTLALPCWRLAPMAQLRGVRVSLCAASVGKPRRSGLCTASV